MRLLPPAARRAAAQRGSAVIVLMVILAILLTFVAANLRTLHTLDRELKLIEKRQVQKWQKTDAAAAKAEPPKP